jgi:hypothetical protein
VEKQTPSSGSLPPFFLRRREFYDKNIGSLTMLVRHKVEQETKFFFQKNRRKKHGGNARRGNTLEETAPDPVTKPDRRFG